MPSQSLPLQPTCRASLAAKVVDYAPEKKSMGAAIWDTLCLWQARVWERAHLAALDDRMLKDIGLSRSGAYRETAKPFWRA